MESRTSPGKRGSVQPLSGYPVGAFCLSFLEYRPVLAVLVDILVVEVVVWLWLSDWA